MEVDQPQPNHVQVPSLPFTPAQVNFDAVLSALCDVVRKSGAFERSCVTSRAYIDHFNVDTSSLCTYLMPAFLSRVKAEHMRDMIVWLFHLGESLISCCFSQRFLMAMPLV